MHATVCVTAIISDQVLQTASSEVPAAMAAYLGRLKLATMYIVRTTGFLPCVETLYIHIYLVYTCCPFLGREVYTMGISYIVYAHAVRFGIASLSKMLRCALYPERCRS